MPPKRHLKLTSVRHVRRLLANTINQLMNDEISFQTANSIASLCTVMLKTIKLSNLEERLQQLETALELENKTPTPVTSDVDRMIHGIKQNSREAS